MPETNPGTANLISWWEFDENGGTAYDAHGSNHLTEVSGTIPLAAGGGRDFEAGDTEYLSIASNPSIEFANEPMFLCFWIKPETIQAQYIVSKGASGQVSEWFVVFSTGDTNSPSFYVGLNGSTTNVTVKSAQNLSAGNLACVMVWHDPDNDVIAISVNNEAPVTTAHTLGLANAGTNPLRFGASSQAATSFFDGVQNKPCLLGAIPTADERTWLFNSGTPRSYSELTGIESANQINWW